MKTIHYLYVSLVAIFLFFFLSIFIINGNPIFYDAPIYEFLKLIPFQDFFIVITKFGDWLFILFCLCLALVFLNEKKSRKFLACTMLIEIGLNIGLKNFFQRERPNLVHLTHETGYSFPSGHAMASTCFYLLMIYFIWKSGIRKSLKVIFTVILSLLILLICVSRVYLGVHYVSDILGGFFLGVFLVCMGIFLYSSVDKPKK